MFLIIQKIHCAKTILYNFHFRVPKIIFVSTILNADIWQLPAVAIHAELNIFIHRCKLNCNAKFKSTASHIFPTV